MPEILSQKQIDELLQELTGNTTNVKIETEEKKIKTYNFKNPKKLSRDQQKVLAGIHEIFARHLASYITGLTRSICEINVVSVEEHPYFEYNNALPDILMTGILDVNIIKGSVLLDMSNSLTYALVERMLGGNIEDYDIPTRDFTDVELALMERIFKKLAVYFQEAWSHIPNVSISLRQIETNTRFIRTIAMDEIVVVIVLGVKINNVKGMITCCIPCLNLGEVIDKFNSKLSRVVQESNEEDVEYARKAILEKINDTAIEIRGILGAATITMKELLSLQVGDVIKLDQSVDSQTLVTVNGKKWFYGQPGIKKNKIAVKINQKYS